MSTASSTTLAETTKGKPSVFGNPCQLQGGDDALRLPLATSASRVMLLARCLNLLVHLIPQSWRFSCCVFSPAFDQKHANAKETCAKHVSVMFSGLGPRGRHCSKRLNRQACFILPPRVNPMQCRCTQISTHCIGASANVMTPGSYIAHAPDKVLIAKAIVDFLNSKGKASGGATGATRSAASGGWICGSHDKQNTAQRLWSQFVPPHASTVR